MSDELSAAVLKLQEVLIASCTGGEEDEDTYQVLRRRLLSEPSVRGKVPDLVKDCRSLDEFWHHIKELHGTYMERRRHIWAEFRPLLDQLEFGSDVPLGQHVENIALELGVEEIRHLWFKALDRLHRDPDGAITASRALLESVCKSVLQAMGESYKNKWSLPRLYREAVKHLNLSPNQHAEEVFRKILGGCSSVVDGLAFLRNEYGDAHGKGPRRYKPDPRHAQLAVDLAGSISVFLVATLKARCSG